MTNDLTAAAKIYSVDGKKIFEKSANVKSIDADNAVSALNLKDILKQHPALNFIVLSLKNNKDEEVSKNIYWTAKGNDYKALNNMPETKLQITIINSSISENEKTIKLKVKNTGNQIAFFTHVELAQNGEEIMPSFWSDNYFSLLPGEEQTLTVKVPVAEIKNNSPLKIEADGWNVKKNVVEVK